MMRRLALCLVLLAASGSGSSNETPAVSAWVGPREVGLFGRF